MKSDVDDLDVVAFAHALTFQLPGWQVKPEREAPEHDTVARRNWRATLWLTKGVPVEEDRPSITLVWSTYNRELTISGDFPDQYRGFDKNNRISVNAARPLARIASDVHSRLINPYLEAHAAAIAERKADRQKQEATRKNLAALVKALRTEMPRQHNSHVYDRTHEYTVYGGEGRGRWKLSSYKPGLVDVEVTLPIAAALKLAALLKPAKKGGSRG